MALYEYDYYYYYYYNSQPGPSRHLGMTSTLQYSQGKYSHRCCHLPNKVEHIDLTPRTPHTYNGMCPSKKLPIPNGRSVPPSNTRFHGPSRIHTGTKRRLIGSSAFAGLTNRQTDTQSTKHRSKYRISRLAQRCGLKTAILPFLRR